MAQKRFKFLVTYRFDGAIYIAEQLTHVIGNRRIRTLYGYTAVQTNISNACTDQDFIFAAVDLKLVGLDVEIAERFVIQRDGDSLALAGLKEDLSETLYLYQIIR